ncbi:ribbon-helix-helix domain-containing protein [Peribacillus castrilensis]|uniref:ribbon-helix-helix protein, CopG family n=1 Tax=Peribacillus castrilensis TaxID=2897690 RepID=UPI003D29F9CD
MGILTKLSKKKGKEPRNQPISSRLTESEYKAFEELCIETGYSMSEALRLLVQQEIKGNDEDTFTERIQNYSESKQVDAESKPTEPIRTPIPYKPSTNVVNRKRVATTTGRWTANEWKVNDELPCTICDSWVSASNFSRHLKKLHDNVSTQEFFTKYADRANEMVKERIESTQ